MCFMVWFIPGHKFRFSAPQGDFIVPQSRIPLYRIQTPRGWMGSPCFRSWPSNEYGRLHVSHELAPLSVFMNVENHFVRSRFCILLYRACFNMQWCTKCAVMNENVQWWKAALVMILGEIRDFVVESWKVTKEIFRSKCAVMIFSQSMLCYSSVGGVLVWCNRTWNQMIRLWWTNQIQDVGFLPERKGPLTT